MADEDLDSAPAAGADHAEGDVAIKAPDRPGVRRRRKLTRRLEEKLEQDGGLSATTDLMVAERPDHTVRLSGGVLGKHGGPADKVIELLGGLVDLVYATFPNAQPELSSVLSIASVDVTFHVPESEIRAADAWRLYKEDEEGFEGLPDTTLALASIAEVLALSPEGAAAGARSISAATATKLKSFALDLSEREVSLVLPRSRETTVDLFEMADPAWAIDVVSRLDAFDAVAPRTVEVTGVLQGANSGGDVGRGQFEIKTDDRLALDPALGSRLGPGAVIKGELSPAARKQIREGGLWDTHVVAKVRVTRRQQGRSIRVESRELRSVKPRFH